MLNDSLIEFVAADADCIGNNHAEQRNNRHFRCTAADIAYHIAGRFGNRDIRADGRCKRFFKHFDAACPRFQRAFVYGAAFHIGNTARYSDNHARLNKPVARQNFGNKIPDHFFSRIFISYNTVFQWPDSDNITGRSPQHPFSLGADRHYRFCPALHSDNRRFINDNPLPFYIDNSITGS